jgi:hypothetical protein
MPNFLVPITRATTETTMVDVEADTALEARDIALGEVQQFPGDFDWTLDEGNVNSDPYFAGGDDLEAIELES